MHSANNSCRVCGASGNHRIFAVKEMMFGTRTLFEYFECCACGCLQISSIPNDLSSFYPDDYYSFQFVPGSENGSRTMHWMQKQRCRTALFGRGYKLNSILKNFVELPEALYKRHAGIPTGEVLGRAGISNFSSRFLDVGCGSFSLWLDNLSALGFVNLSGIDPFIAKDQTYKNVTIKKRSLHEVNESYDLVTFHHSLEHMPLQLDALIHARKLLSPGGTCLVRIPIVSSLVWEMYGVNWVELDAPRHLYLHSVESITKVGFKAGLELYDVVYDSVPFEFYGSELYARDIALNDPRSPWISPNSSLFSEEEMAAFESLAKQANIAGRGGRAGFYFRAGD